MSLCSGGYSPLQLQRHFFRPLCPLWPTSFSFFLFCNFRFVHVIFVMTVNVIDQKLHCLFTFSGSFVNFYQIHYSRWDCTYCLHKKTSQMLMYQCNFFVRTVLQNEGKKKCCVLLKTSILMNEEKWVAMRQWKMKNIRWIFHSSLVPRKTKTDCETKARYLTSDTARFEDAALASFMPLVCSQSRDFAVYLLHIGCVHS